MIIVTEPTVRIVAKTVSTYINDLVPDHECDLDRIVAVGGKVCYNAYGADGRPINEHVQRLIESKHYSVLEHVSVSMLITGISRGLSHELVRHRHLSFSQRSTRYVDEGDERVVLEPKIIELREKDPNEYEFYLQSLQASFKAYNDFVDTFIRYAPQTLSKTEQRKYARGAARQLLPNALETQMVVTGNMRTWNEVLRLRSGVGAEAEIRRLMFFIYYELDATFQDTNLLPKEVSRFDNLPVYE